ncbi:unnamed protein product, partial [Prorocentrum cordatum]
GGGGGGGGGGGSGSGPNRGGLNPRGGERPGGRPAAGAARAAGERERERERSPLGRAPPRVEHQSGSSSSSSLAGSGLGRQRLTAGPELQGHVVGGPLRQVLPPPREAHGHAGSARHVALCIVQRHDERLRVPGRSSANHITKELWSNSGDPSTLLTSSGSKSIWYRSCLSSSSLQSLRFQATTRVLGLGLGALAARRRRCCESGGGQRRRGGFLRRTRL